MEFYQYIRNSSVDDELLLHYTDALTKIDVKAAKYELPTFYWLPNLHISPITSHVMPSLAIFIFRILNMSFMK